MAFVEVAANTLDDAALSISNSCRFGSDTDLKRLPSSTGSSLRGTLSVWVKFCTDDTEIAIIGGWDNSGANDDDGYMVFKRLSTGQLQFNGGDDVYLKTTAKFRDVSAWYHIVLAIDSAQNDNNAQRIYVNGTEITDFATRNNLTNLQDLPMNTTAGNDDALLIGCDEDTGGKGLHFNGYMSEFFWIDGTQYAASDFGEFNDNGVYLEFKETGTSANSSGIGADTGGNNLHFTVTNLTAQDITTDTPTNNFATLNPLMAGRGSTLSEGNLKVSGESDNNYDVSTIGTSMKFYFEWKLDEAHSGGNGIKLSVMHEDEIRKNDNYASFATKNVKTYTNSNDGKYQDGNGQNPSGGGSLTRATDDDIIMVACDGGNGKVWFGVNGTWLSSGDPANDTGGFHGSWSAAMNTGIYFACPIYSGTNGAGQINFGNPTFSISSGNSDENGYGNFEYAVPSGFLALCTKNLGSDGG